MSKAAFVVSLCMLHRYSIIDAFTTPQQTSSWRTQSNFPRRQQHVTDQNRPFSSTSLLETTSNLQEGERSEDIMLDAVLNTTSTAALIDDFDQVEEDSPPSRIASARKQEATTNITDPTYRTLLIFSITTVIIWLSEPLLSLVDTTIIGLTQKSAVTQLASLGPATTLMDSLLYSTYGLSIATTNRIAAERAIDHNERQLQTTVSHVIGISILFGTLCTTICWGFARPMLTLMAGSSGTPELISFATRYTYIRSAVSVASVTGVTLQSICLAQQDVRTPSRAVLVASVTNLVGDIALRKHGVIGAAVATAAASTFSAMVLLRSVRQQFRLWKSKDAKDDEPIPLVSLPDRKAAWNLLKLAGPIFFVIIAKILCYGAMTLRCTEFGVNPLAAQSILMRVFFFFACFGDAFSQTAQSFLPATLYPKPDRAAFVKIFRKLVWLAAIVGLLNSQASTFILQRFGSYLTNDNGIIGLMQHQSGFVGVSLFFHAIIMVLEGVVLASRDLRSLTATYAITVTMHFSILKLLCGSFTGVWKTFVLFQSTRLAMYAFRVAKQFRREAAVVGS